MAMKKAGTKRSTLKRRAAPRGSARKGKGERVVLQLPMEGKVKRADIRKAVLAVRAEKRLARASAGAL